jgi:hypothetical protein
LPADSPGLGDAVPGQGLDQIGRHEAAMLEGVGELEGGLASAAP